MILKHRARSKHQNADALSRIRAHEHLECDQFIAGVTPTELPCGGCRYCVRADSQWGTFTREVDDAVPLTMLNSGARGVVHDAGLPESGSNDHGGLEHFSFGVVV